MVGRGHSRAESAGAGDDNQIYNVTFCRPGGAAALDRLFAHVDRGRGQAARTGRSGHDRPDGRGQRDHPVGRFRRAQPWQKGEADLTLKLVFEPSEEGKTADEEYRLFWGSATATGPEASTVPWDLNLLFDSNVPIYSGGENYEIALEIPTGIVDEFSNPVSKRDVLEQEVSIKIKKTSGRFTGSPAPHESTKATKTQGTPRTVRRMIQSASSSDLNTTLASPRAYPGPDYLSRPVASAISTTVSRSSRRTEALDDNRLAQHFFRRDTHG